MTDQEVPGGRTADDEHSRPEAPDAAAPPDAAPPDAAPPAAAPPAVLTLGDEVSGGTERPARPARIRLVVLGSLLMLGVAATAVAGTAGYRIVSQKDATLSTPAQVGALRRNDGEDARSTAEYLRTALSAEVDLDEAVGAVYTDSGGPNRSVLFFGGTTVVWTPEADLETAFELMSDDAGAVSNLHDVPPGDLGGTMKCGTATSPDGDMAVCGWADHGSLALALFPNRTPDEAAPVLATIRKAAQRRE